MTNKKETAIEFAKTRYQEAKQKKNTLTKRLRNLYVQQANLAAGKSGDFSNHTFKEKINMDIKKTAEQLMTVKRELLIPLSEITRAIEAD